MSRRREIAAMYESYPAKRLGHKSGHTMVKLLFWVAVSAVWYFCNEYVIFGVADLVMPGNTYRAIMVGLLPLPLLVFCFGSLLILFLISRSGTGLR